MNPRRPPHARNILGALAERYFAAALLGLDGYKAFLQRRRAMIVERLNKFLGAPDAGL